MKESIIDKILSSSGYLPPRNEKEMIVFEREFSKVKIKENFHVDVDSIVNGGCQARPLVRSIRGGTAETNDVRMAARNFESIPEDVIEKIKKQHKCKND